jgi:phosphoenolpyruvate synthase/pyruvate phosphate dikinase
VVYDRALDFQVERLLLDALPRPTTKGMLNVGNPEEACGFSFLPNDGVGLAAVRASRGRWTRLFGLFDFLILRARYSE